MKETLSFPLLTCYVLIDQHNFFLLFLWLQTINNRNWMGKCITIFLFSKKKSFFQFTTSLKPLAASPDGSDILYYY